MTNKLREALEKIAEGDQIEVDCIMRGEWEALCDYQREIAKAALNEPQVDWKEKFEKEQRACNHWFKEANKSHNEACKIADEFREFKEKHQQPPLTEEEMVRIVFDKLEPETRDSLEIQHIALIAQSITRAIIARLTEKQ